MQYTSRATAPAQAFQVRSPASVGAKHAGRGIVSMLGGLALVVLHGCGGPASCNATGGEWNDCAAVQAWCIGGEVTLNDQESPAVCEQGCTCPSDAPVWDAAAGCITETSCAGAAPTDGS
jgi:hypothetical protein